MFSGAIIHECGALGRWDICGGWQKHEHGWWAWKTRGRSLHQSWEYAFPQTSRNSYATPIWIFWCEIEYLTITWFAGRRKEEQGPEMGCVQGKSVLTDEDIDFIARNTAMKREAVEMQYKTFLQKHPDGRISRKSFHMMMKECYPGEQYHYLSCLLPI